MLRVLPLLGVSAWLCLTQACHRPLELLWKVTHPLGGTGAAVQPCQVGLGQQQKLGLRHRAKVPWIWEPLGTSSP